MAYNVLKGAVEGSVDQHADQEIGGVKVFKNTISASVFYDTDAQSACATVNKVAFDELVASTVRGILTYEGDRKAKAHRNLLFDGKNFRTDNAVFNTITGSAGGLTGIPADQIAGKIPGHSIECGVGLEDKNGSLRVMKHDGIKVTEDGTSVDISPNGALSFKNGKIGVDPLSTLNVVESGQNISDNDTLLMYDASRGDVRHTTFRNLYDNYVNLNVPLPAGSKNSIQLKGNKEFEGSDNLKYDTSNNTLTVVGTTKSVTVECSKELRSNGTTSINGALYKAIKTVSERTYAIQDTDNTVLLDVSENKVIATLPPANENYGRVITIKVIVGEDQKYRIRGTNSAKIITDGELIDFTQEINLKSNYSSRTLQSDGDKWWIINANGS